MVWPIITRHVAFGSAHTTNPASASQRMMIVTRPSQIQKPYLNGYRWWIGITRLFDSSHHGITSGWSQTGKSRLQYADQSDKSALLQSTAGLPVIREQARA